MCGKKKEPQSGTGFSVPLTSLLMKNQCFTDYPISTFQQIILSSYSLPSGSLKKNKDDFGFWIADFELKTKTIPIKNLITHLIKVIFLTFITPLDSSL